MKQTYFGILKWHLEWLYTGHGNLSAFSTLQNGLLFYNQDLTSYLEAGLVHRLDKDTTGLILAAKTADAYNQLVKDMQARFIQRSIERYVEAK